MRINTLTFDAHLCINCHMCSIVCPHGVFAPGEDAALLVRHGDCMECGACQLNCPTEAIQVDSGVGCAAAMIHAALLGGEPNCGPDPAKAGCDPSGSCQPPQPPVHPSPDG